MTKSTETIKALNTAVDRLMCQLFAKQEELRRCESSQGTAHNVRRMVRLREQIESLEKRLTRAERLQEAALCGRID